MTTAQPELDRELDLLEQRLPGKVARLVRWLRRPTSRLARYPLAIILIFGGLLGFLPILGFWMVPLGLVLLAQDVPVLRGPLARVIAYVNRKLKRT